MTILLSPPLKKMRCTQPFGVNWVYQGFYRSVGIPSDLHNGWDLKALNEPIFAPCDGIVSVSESLAAGKIIYLHTPVSTDGREMQQAFFHCSETPPNQMSVKRGDQIGVTGATGTGAKGPHLHYGLRFLKEGLVENYGNGYHGCLDPAQFYPRDIFDLSVDKAYGNTPRTPGVPSELVWYKTNVWFWFTFKRLMTVRERNAFRFGFWDLRTVLDPAMFPIWSEHSKIEAVKLGLIK